MTYYSFNKTWHLQAASTPPVCWGGSTPPTSSGASRAARRRVAVGLEGADRRRGRRATGAPAGRAHVDSIGSQRWGLGVTHGVLELFFGCLTVETLRENRLQEENWELFNYPVRLRRTELRTRLADVFRDVMKTLTCSIQNNSISRVQIWNVTWHVFSLIVKPYTTLTYDL